MAFKMKNPGMGKMAKAAGSPHKFGIENKGMDSAARGTKAIGSDGQPLKMKKDFGMEGSAMKFKGIRDKIAARRVSKNKFVMADEILNYKNNTIFIKIDTEGHEQYVLQGATELIKNNNIFLQIEIWDKNLNEVNKNLKKMNLVFLKKINNDYFFKKN